MDQQRASSPLWPEHVLTACLLFVLPLVYIAPAADPAALPRRILVHLVASVLTYLLLIRGAIPWRSFLAKPAHWLLLVFLLLQLASTLWAADGPGSRLAAIRWFTGFQLYLAAFTLAGPRAFRLWAAAALSGGGLAALIGIAQAHGINLPPYSQTFGPAATFINKNVAVQFLVALLPAAVWLMLETRHLIRWLFALFSGLIVAYLVLTWSRSAILAISAWLALLSLYRFSVSEMHMPRRQQWFPVIAATVLALVVLPGKQNLLQTLITEWRSFALVIGGVLLPALPVGLWVFMNNRRIRPGPRRLYALALTALVGLSGILLLVLDQKGPAKGIYLRISAVLEQTNPDAHVNSAAVRLAMNLNGLAMVHDNPLFGTGAGSFRGLYPLYHQARVPTPSQTITTLPQRLHNDFLEAMIETGIPGGLAFMGFVALLLTGGWRQSRQAGDHRGLFSSLTATLLIIIAVALFSFPLHMPVSSCWFWICAGLLVGQNTKPAANNGLEKRGRWICVAGLVVNILVLLFYAKALYASLLLGEAKRQLAIKNPGVAYTYTHHAWRVFPNDWHNLDQLLTLATRYSSDREQALAVADQFLQREPHHPNGHYRRAVILRSMERREEALTAMEHALRLGGPDYVGLHFKGVVLRELGRREDARQAFKASLKQKPIFWPPQKALQELNQEDREATKSTR